MTLPWLLMASVWLQWRTTARFHSVPQAGVPGGTGRNPIGRPVALRVEMPPPPMNPSLSWSKLPVLKSSITIPPTMGPHPSPVDRLRIGRKELPGSGLLIEGNHRLHDKGQRVLHGKMAVL